MARYGKAKTESTIGAKSTDTAEPEAVPFPKEHVFYRRISRSATARTVSVSALVKPEWDYIRIDVRPRGPSQWEWLVTPLLDSPSEPTGLARATE